MPVFELDPGTHEMAGCHRQVLIRIKCREALRPSKVREAMVRTTEAAQEATSNMLVQAILKLSDSREKSPLPVYIVLMLS